MYYVAYNALPDDEPKDDNKDKDKDDDDHHFFNFHRPSFDKYWKARLISIAVAIVVTLVVFVPMRLWKRKVSALMLVICVRRVDRVP